MAEVTNKFGDIAGAGIINPRKRAEWNEAYTGLISPATGKQVTVFGASMNDATAARAFNTTYTNAAAYSIEVMATVRCVITLAAGSATIQGKSDADTPPVTPVSGVVGIQAGLLDEDNTHQISFVVAPGANYRIDSVVANGTATLGKWLEVAL